MLLNNADAHRWSFIKGSLREDKEPLSTLDLLLITISQFSFKTQSLSLGPRRSSPRPPALQSNARLLNCASPAAVELIQILATMPLRRLKTEAAVAA